MNGQGRIYLVGVGGLGVISASQIAGEALMQAGVPVVLGEIHGMAQRGGIVEVSLSFGGIASPIVEDGTADVVMGFEPLETYRAINKGHENALIISNTRPIIPFTVSLGHFQYPSVPEMMNQLKEHSRRLITMDAVALALKAGNAKAASVVLLGALAHTRVLPVNQNQWIHAIKAKLPEKIHEVNMTAFQLGFDAAGECSLAFAPPLSH